MEIFETFGLEWPKLIAQVIIVLLVYFVLSKFAFGPVIAMLQARRERIVEGEEKLKRIEKDLEQTEEKVQGMLDEANRDAERVISEARESAEAVREQKTTEAEKEARQITEKAREAARLEHEQTMNELKRDFGRLLTDTTSKVTGKVLDEDDQKRINEETAGQVAL